ncbi:MAG TPA: helix-turn-helix domain-containing protein [Polyangia bacterium]|nr:helix-turn-helix domain-containing protein [Polyangia bacterium]
MEVTSPPAAAAGTAECPVVKFNDVVGGKYKLRILWELSPGPRRYTHVQRALAVAMGGRRITPRVLSRELRELAAAGLIARRQYPVIPPKVEYSLTPAGRALRGVLRAICKWGLAS